MAVAGTARRLGAPGRLQPTDDGGEHLRVPDAAGLLHRLGATAALTAWRQRHALIPDRPRT
ncbi:hypothetical protein EV385_6700 [Krasilnikovia cinnamomea]|uniref:Uncharacterized protein n=1 Tax=Krasilnikovia cinnamomea TaxID=349313 RepID=A0A4Q7Z990_9ACTN|nr:hypothetical protein [Krasilnikovia cinnamomea]RZU46624.1 hypothetical protein EV385_6700 [Krasilnikovia cinnamomea]